MVSTPFLILTEVLKVHRRRLVSTFLYNVANVCSMAAAIALIPSTSTARSRSHFHSPLIQLLVNFHCQFALSSNMPTPHIPIQGFRQNATDEKYNSKYGTSGMMQQQR
jgi:hypothetical protein